MDIYKTYITGYVKGDPKIYNGQTTVASFTVASFKGKNKDGESMGYAYNDVKAFKGTADYIAQHVHDGDYVMIEATIEKGHFTNRDGIEVWTEDIKILNIKAFTPTQQGNNANSDGGAWR